jgi:hypothetical protein
VIADGTEETRGRASCYVVVSRLSGKRIMSYDTKLTLLTAAIFVGLSLAFANIAAKIELLVSMTAK